MRKFTILILSSLHLISIISSTHSTNTDTLTQSQPFTDRGGSTLVSASGKFVLGFFSPGRSKSRYLGIWYSFSTPTVVWVANRQAPIPDRSGALAFTADGVLTLLSNSTNSVWTATATPARPVLRLMDTGNLVVTGAASPVPLWQSFDHPTDTMLPTQKLGYVDGAISWTLTSWASPDDPGPGEHTCMMADRGLHEIYVKRNDATLFRFGPWVGTRFSGIPRMSSYGAGLIEFDVIITEEEAYYIFNVTSAATYTQLGLNPSTPGVIQRVLWNGGAGGWTVLWDAPSGDCDNYNHCGPNGVCDSDVNLNVCSCYRGYRPRNGTLWGARDFGLGCEREVEMNCSDVGFVAVEGVKLPDGTNASMDGGIGLEQCRERCAGNCSCTAYAALFVGNGSGCIVWFGDLVDTRTFVIDGQVLYLKLPASEIAKARGSESKWKTIVAIVSAVIFIVIASGCVFIWKTYKGMHESKSGQFQVDNINDEMIAEWEEVVPFYSYATVAAATGNFSVEKMIGRGGFSLVYKGTTENGVAVAVKRLTKISTQSLEEFMNEVLVIAKLQHRNVVRLVGCCIEKEERILIYEYMKNNSLDTFIFGTNDLPVLDWKTRKDIILGIAKGLVYLHEDSVPTVIHRDLKTANILLDDSLTPKISDFGTVRIFGGDLPDDNNTRRVIGTRGYMAPEYAIEGAFSVKSDVFSFGVMMLEIISGIRNSIRSTEQRPEYLIHTAWSMWRNGESLQLVDGRIPKPLPESEAERCIQISLLCVQDFAIDRPTMSRVVMMLSDEHIPLGEPLKPGFHSRSGNSEGAQRSTSSAAQSANVVTITQAGR